MSREPVVHIAKRDEMPFGKAVMVRLAAVFLSLLVCALVIFVLTRLNPIEVYEAIFSGAVGTARRTWVTVRDSDVYKRQV